MKYQISCIGKSSNSLENKLIEKFTRRISNKITIKEVIVKKKISDCVIEKEGDMLLEISPKDSTLILLDKNGDCLTTEKFYKIIKGFEMENIKKLNFVIGGPNGHGEKIKKKAKLILCFGKMTWSHLLTRVMLVEQLYRIETMFKKHPYHK